MDKIYRLLPWLNAGQAVDWLSRLTETEMTEALLVSLCEAEHCRVFIDVGAACSGLDDEDWITNVIASGKHLVVDPSDLTKDPSAVGYMVLRGNVMRLDGGKSEINKDTKWFPASISSFVICFKQPDILALADKINADEAADKAELLAQAERHRAQREQDLNALSDAQEEIIRLQDQLNETLNHPADRGLSQSVKNSHLLTIGGLLRLIKNNDRPRYNQGGLVNAISEMNWSGASATTLNHIFADANAAAKDADSELRAKLNSIDLAVKKSTEA